MGFGRQHTFDWWVFADNAITNQFYLFGWDTGNVNDPARAALCEGDDVIRSRWAT